MIEARAKPGIETAVALLTVRGESTRLMVWRLGIHERGRVADDAVG